MSHNELRYWQPEHGISLLRSTGIMPIDQILRGLIGLIGGSFPDRVRGYYLEGSYAGGSAVATSDIDLRIVFKEQLDPEEKRHATYLIDCCWLISARPLDLVLDSEAALLRIGAVRFQQASILLFGDDIRSAAPLKPLAISGIPRIFRFMCSLVCAAILTTSPFPWSIQIRTASSTAMIDARRVCRMERCCRVPRIWC